MRATFNDDIVYVELDRFLRFLLHQPPPFHYPQGGSTPKDERFEFPFHIQI